PAVDGHGPLGLPWIHREFEVAGIVPLPHVCRYPFRDVGLLTFLLNLPGFAVADMRVLRVAVRGKLREGIRPRPKTAAHGGVLRARVWSGKIWPGLDDFDRLPPPVDSKAFRSAWADYLSGAGTDSTWASWLIVAPIAYGIWMSDREVADEPVA